MKNWNGTTDRVFISGRMAGLEEKEWRKRFNDAEIELIKAGFHPDNILNPAKLSMIYPNLDRETYIKIDLAMVDSCAIVYALDNWEQSDGARHEVYRARMNGSRIVFEDKTNGCKNIFE